MKLHVFEKMNKIKKLESGQIKKYYFTKLFWLKLKRIEEKFKSDD